MYNLKKFSMRSKSSCRRSLIRAMVVTAMLTAPTQFVSAQLNVTLSNSTVGAMIKQIQSQSKYRFFYDDEVESIPIKKVSLTDASIGEVLDKALSGKNISYRIDENVVYLSRPGEKVPSTEQTKKQPKKITGKIVDANGEPLIGVSVLEKRYGQRNNYRFRGKLYADGSGRLYPAILLHRIQGNRDAGIKSVVQQPDHAGRFGNAG